MPCLKKKLGPTVSGFGAYATGVLCYCNSIFCSAAILLHCYATAVLRHCSVHQPLQCCTTAVHINITLPWRSTTPLQWHSTAVAYTMPLQWRSTAVSTPLQGYATAVLRHYSGIVLRHCSAAPLQCYATAVLRHRSATPLQRYVTAALCHCSARSLQRYTTAV